MSYKVVICWSVVEPPATTERFHRINVGEMEILITIDDPQSYTKLWTVKIGLHLLPDTDLIEDVCDNEKDNAHTIK